MKTWSVGTIYTGGDLKIDLDTEFDWNFMIEEGYKLDKDVRRVFSPEQFKERARVAHAWFYHEYALNTWSISMKVTEPEAESLQRKMMTTDEEQMVVGDSDVNALCREMSAIEQEMEALHQRIRELIKGLKK